LREAISTEKRHFTSHVVHVDNLDARLHLGYAKHAIVQQTKGARGSTRRLGGTSQDTASPTRFVSL